MPRKSKVGAQVERFLDLASRSRVDGSMIELYASRARVSPESFLGVVAREAEARSRTGGLGLRAAGNVRDLLQRFIGEDARKAVGEIDHLLAEKEALSASGQVFHDRRARVAELAEQLSSVPSNERAARYDALKKRLVESGVPEGDAVGFLAGARKEASKLVDRRSAARTLEARRSFVLREAVKLLRAGHSKKSVAFFVSKQPGFRGGPGLAARSSLVTEAERLAARKRFLKRVPFVLRRRK